MSLGGVDLAILAIYLSGVVALGMWIGRGAQSAEQYALGGREQPWLLILFSIVATETSSVTFLSIPGFAYGRDLTWLQVAFGFLLGRVAVAYLFLPQYFRGAFVTAYEALDARFGGAVSQAGPWARAPGGLGGILERAGGAGKLRVIDLSLSSSLNSCATTAVFCDRSRHRSIARTTASATAVRTWTILRFSRVGWTRLVRRTR